MPERENLPPSLQNSPELLRKAIHVTEELLESLRLEEPTPENLAERQFYQERLTLLKVWLSHLHKTNPPTE